MKTHFSTENSLVFVVVCSLVCFGSTQKDETKGVSRTYVTEGEAAILHCSYRGSLEKTVVDWKKDQDKEVFFYENGVHYDNGRHGQDAQYKDRVELFYDELKNGNASMILRNTRIEDTGIYSCVLPHLSSGRQIFNMELIVSVSRTYVNKGEDAVLHCSSGRSLENTVVNWKNKDKEVFFYESGLHYENGRSGQDDQYKGRVSLFYDKLKNRNASMILRNTSVEDAGIYTCSLSVRTGHSEQSRKELIVGVSRTYVKEGEDAVLHCSAGGNLKDTVIQWKDKHSTEVFLYSYGQHSESGRSSQDDQYRGRVSLFYDELKNGNASMILRNTRVEDTGIYTCEFPRLSSGKQIWMKLIVEPVFKDRCGLEKGAVHAPYLGISKETEDGVELQCVVRGSPSKLSVEWETCEGIPLNATGQTVSERRGRYDTTVYITVTDMRTNCFSCVVKQEDIYHRVDSQITLPEKRFEKTLYSTGDLVGFCFAGIFTVVLLLLPLTLLLIITIRRSRRKMMGMMTRMMTSMEEMECRSTNTTSVQNIGNRIINVENVPEEEVKFMPTNKTSGETNGDIELKIRQTDSVYDERWTSQSIYEVGEKYSTAVFHKANPRKCSV